MSIPELGFEGVDIDGEPVEMSLFKELLLHGDNSTMARLTVDGRNILLTISDLRLFSIVADHLADALEFGGN
jgi:hypothetical protein